MDKTKAQVHANPHVSVSCESYNCLNRAEYAIGRPDGPNTVKHFLCESCLQNVADSILESGIIELSGGEETENSVAEMSLTEKERLLDQLLADDDVQALLYQNVEEAEEYPRKDEKPEHICTVCDRTFGTQQALAAHSRAHKEG